MMGDSGNADLVAYQAFLWKQAWSKARKMDFGSLTVLKSHQSYQNQFDNNKIFFSLYCMLHKNRQSCRLRIEVDTTFDCLSTSKPRGGS